MSSRSSHRLPRGRLLAAALACGAGCGGDDATVDSDAETTAGDSDGSGSSGPGSSGSADTTTGGPATFCAGPTVLQYDPLAMRLDAFPDDFFTVDEDTPSGVRVDLRPGENVALDGASMPFAPLFDDASTLDGFGTTAGIFLRIGGPLRADTLPPALHDGPAATDTLVLVDLDADPVEFVGIEWEQIAEDPGSAETTLLVEPLAPLRPMHRYGLALTTGALAEDGSCVAPSPAMISVLDGSAADPALVRIVPRVADFVGTLVDLGVVDGATDLTAAVVFTTQHTTDDSAAIAAEIREADAPVFVPDGPCTDPGATSLWVKCAGTIDVLDYTDANEAVAADLTAQGGYSLPARVWLPKAGTAPFPTFVYGHGLAGDKDEADALADFVAPIGGAVIAVDAPKHGDHPDAPAGIAVLDFFGLSLNLADPLDALKLRDNFRQGTYDRLQVVSAIGGGIDADDDGTVDLDIERLHYLGVSLGGIMGAELVAFTPEFDTATLIVPGARVGNIVAEGEQFSIVVDIFAAMASAGEIARFFPLLQTAIDRGDAGAYLRHVALERLPGFDEATPQVLMQMVLADDTVPNSANAFFARGLGAPLVGDELLPIGLVALEPDLPTMGNFDAQHTWGLFQYDILDADGTVAEHGSVARSLPAQTQITRFVQTNLDAGVSELIDPYRELGIK